MTSANHQMPRPSCDAVQHTRKQIWNPIDTSSWKLLPL